MKIREINIKDLTVECVGLLIKTYTELGQTPSEQVVFVLSNSLANDLKKRFKDLTWNDVEKAFERGVRETDDFHLTVKTYFKWLTYWKKQVIWDAEYQANVLNKPKKEIPYFKDTMKQLKQITIKNKNNDKN